MSTGLLAWLIVIVLFLVLLGWLDVRHAGGAERPPAPPHPDDGGRRCRTRS